MAENGAPRDVAAPCTCGHSADSHYANNAKVSHWCEECECLDYRPAAPVVIAYPHETANGVTIHAAAPLSTLPERPTLDDVQRILSKAAAAVDTAEDDRTFQWLSARIPALVIEGCADPECIWYKHATGLSADLTRFGDENEALRSRVSSLERELEAVRSERETADG